MSEAYIGVVGSLAGVIVGLFGGEIVRIFRKRVELNKLKREIHQDLSVIQMQLPAMKNLIDIAEEKTQNGIPMALQYKAFPSSGFERHFPRLYSHYKMKERICLQVIFSEIQAVEDVMKNILERAQQMAAISGKPEKWAEAYLVYLTGLKGSIVNIESTLTPLLDGDIEAAYLSLSRDA